MAKKKKGKVVQLKQAQQSAENYIKTQARSLPIAECWITKDWQNAGMCNVIVARRHKNENTTLGIYLVDLYCLGLKDADYEFNVSPADYKRIKQHPAEIEACEYVLAHNIIYGAIAFAEDYGFKPHKDFAIAQYILEEDDENVELMELEFGREGQPFYTRGPHDDNAKVNMIKSTLMRTAGEGNFTVIDSLDDDWDDDEHWDDEDDADELDEPENTDFLDTLNNVNDLYHSLIRTEEGKLMLENSTIGKAYEIVNEPVESYYRKFDDDEQEQHYDRLLDMVVAKEFDEAISASQEAIIQYPGRAQFYNLLQGAYFMNGQHEKSDEMMVEMYKRFPGYLFAFCNYIDLILMSDNVDEAESIIAGRADLNDFYPDRKQFSEHEAAIFYATMCIYFIEKGDIDSADLYLDPILQYDLEQVPGQNIVRIAMMKIGEVKMEKLKNQ